MSVAKLKAVGKALASVIEEGPKPPRREIQNFPARDVRSYFHAAQNELHELRSLLPEMFGDFPDIGIEPEIEMASEPGKARPPNQYSRNQVLQLSREVRHMLDLATEGAPRGMHSILNAPRRVFISHGRAADWREIQPYIEKDLGLDTLELAQQANLGRTILEKLRVEADKCDSAVIVMTGDDTDAGGQARARENVIHEIGYFQGRFGFERVILLHEDEVSIPSNIHGVVYLPFPRGMVRACFGDLVRELKAMYPSEDL